jgi:hypothetical protein
MTEYRWWGRFYTFRACVLPNGDNDDHHHDDPGEDHGHLWELCSRSRILIRVIRRRLYLRIMTQPRARGRFVTLLRIGRLSEFERTMRVLRRMR